MNKKIYDLLGKYDEAGYDREGFSHFQKCYNTLEKNNKKTI